MSSQSSVVFAIALYSFIPTEKDEIQLKVGDNVIVLLRQEDDWWLVKNGSLIGLVPSTYVSITSPNPNPANVESTKQCCNRDETELPFGWDSCIDGESGDVYYFNDNTGITQWERPLLERMSRNTVKSNKNSTESDQDTKNHSNVYINQSNKSDQSTAPLSNPSPVSSSLSFDTEADITRWKKLREEADINIENLRILLSENEKDSNEIKPRLLLPELNTLKTRKHSKKCYSAPSSSSPKANPYPNLTSSSSDLNSSLTPNPYPTRLRTKSHVLEKENQKNKVSMRRYHSLEKNPVHFPPVT
jgi:hypothetical protein